jgi:hypothetical protein
LECIVVIIGICRCLIEPRYLSGRNGVRPMNPEMDNDIHFPNNGEAVCYGYLLAFRGLEGAVEGTDCRRSNDSHLV